MVRSFAADASVLSEQKKWNYYYEKAPLERQNKADKIKRTKDKCLSLGVWSLYDQVCEKYHFSKECMFNFSHSGNHVMCSIAEGTNQDEQIGCDIEQIGKPVMRIAERYFCKTEYEYIQSREGIAAQTEAFYRYWVLKESFMKATRLGTKLALNAFEISISEQKAPILIRQPVEFRKPYYYQEYTIKGLPYKMAVCSTEKEIAQRLEIEEL